MSRDWLTTTEAADRLGVSDSTVLRLHAAGKLEGERRGRGFVFTETSVAEVADQRGRWISQATAGELTGASPNTIARAVAHGELHPRDVDRALPSLNRQEVLDWSDERRRLKANRAARRKQERGRAGPPEDGRVWFDADTAPLVLRLSPSRVRQLARADRLPHVRRGHRLWFMREHSSRLGRRGRSYS